MENPFGELYTKSANAWSVEDKPLFVDVELTNFCNLSCSYCPTGQKKIKRQQGFMADITWYALLDELAEHKIPVRFVRWGEPTLHPRLYEWIGEAHEEGLLAHLTTNGVTLDVDRLRGLDSIKFSWHDIDISNVIEKLYRQESRPYIEIVGYGQPVGVSNIADVIIVEKIKDLSKPLEKYLPCPKVNSILSVNWDGTVTACQGDYDNLMTVGDIFASPLLEIWHGDQMNYYRKMLKEMRHAELPLCRNCARDEGK
jgi:radical SAM protein with 4Fe4S-binding SPASM domain